MTGGTEDARGEGISRWNAEQAGEERADGRAFSRRWMRRAGRTTTGCAREGGMQGSFIIGGEERPARTHPRTVPYPPMVVEDPDGGGRPPTRNDRVRWRF